MPRACVYRHDLRCPHCGSNWRPKHGASGGNRTFHPGATKDRAVAMCTEGNSLRAIGRVLEVPFLTVYVWVKKAREAQPLPTIGRQRRRQAPPAKLISFDEMWTYVGARRGESLCRGKPVAAGGVGLDGGVRG